MFQPFLLTKTVSHALRGAQPLFHTFFGVEILSGTLFAPPLMNAGYGARLDEVGTAYCRAVRKDFAALTYHEILDTGSRRRSLIRNNNV